MIHKRRFRRVEVAGLEPVAGSRWGQTQQRDEARLRAWRDALRRRPLIERVRFGERIDTFDRQPGIGKHPTPLGLVECLVVARIAQLLEGLDVAPNQIVVGQQLVLHEHETSRLHHTCCFPDELRGSIEVVRRDAAGDEVEGVVVEGELLGSGVLEFDVGDTFAGDVCFRSLEHLRRDVAGDDARDVRRELERCVTPTRRHVEDMPVGLRLREFEEALQIRTLRVRRAGDVVLRAFAKTLLGER